MAIKNLKKKTVSKKAATAPEPEKAPEKKQKAPEQKKTNDWFIQGDEGFERKEELDAVAKARRDRNADRFYVSNKNEKDAQTGARKNAARIIFLDREKPFFMYEHKIAIGGNYRNQIFLTCTQSHGATGCPVCEALGTPPTFTAYLTCIDMRRWTKSKPDPKTGATVTEPRRKLFPAKGDAIKIIKKLYEKNDGNLRGLVVDVERTGDKDPNCGRDFEVQGRLSDEKLRAKFGAEMIQPLKYKELLAPPTPEMLKAAGIHVAPIAGSREDIEKDLDEDFEAVEKTEAEEESGDEDVNDLLD